MEELCGQLHRTEQMHGSVIYLQDDRVGAEQMTRQAADTGPRLQYFSIA